MNQCPSLHNKLTFFFLLAFAGPVESFARPDAFAACAATQRRIWTMFGYRFPQLGHGNDGIRRAARNRPTEMRQLLSPLDLARRTEVPRNPLCVPIQSFTSKGVRREDRCGTVGWWSDLISSVQRPRPLWAAATMACPTGSGCHTSCARPRTTARAAARASSPLRTSLR